MAIEMIERNELSALAPSRTGSGFVDDDRYLNASAKKTAAQETKEVLAIRRRFPDPKDCLELDGTMQALDAYIEAVDKAKLMAKGSAQKNLANAQSKAAGIRKAELVRISNILGCSVTKAAAEQAKQSAELQELTQTIQAAKASANDKGGNINYVLYGVLGLAVVGVLVFAIKK
jgi:hypothetical protein